MFPTRRLVAGLLAGAAITLNAAVPALADVELVLSSWLPPRHPVVAKAIKPWAREIGKVTDGRVTVRVLAKPLGSPPAHFDMAVDGVADITYGLHSFTKDDRFARARIGAFSFLGEDAISGSKAYWKVYGDTLDAQAEHDGVKLLGLFVHGPGLLLNAVRKIESVEDIKGLKIRTPGGYISDLMGALGASTLFMSSGEVYEKLSRGVIDGVTFPADPINSFKLDEYIEYATETPGGIYNTTWFVVMNEGKWNEIAPQDQDAIMAISGDAFAERVGQVWNDADAKGLEKAEAAGIEVYEASPELLASIKEAAGKLEADWAEAVSASGHDGAAALAEFREITGVDY